jgi:hypothetical protein
MADRRPRQRGRPVGPPPRDPKPGGEGRHGPVALITMGMGIYFVTLWFGITVIGDNATRSAIMAGVILAIAATGYFVNGRSKPPQTPRK